MFCVVSPGRPCIRCVKRRSENLCQDVVHRKKGRPRKSTYSSSSSSSSSARGGRRRSVVRRRSTEGAAGSDAEGPAAGSDDGDESSAPPAPKRQRVRSPPQSSTPNSPVGVGGHFPLYLSSLRAAPHEGTGAGAPPAAPLSQSSDASMSPRGVHPLVSFSTDRPLSPYATRGSGAQSPVAIPPVSLPLGLTVGAAGAGGGPRFTLPLAHFPPEQAAAAAAIAAAQAQVLLAASLGHHVSDPSGLHIPALQQLQQHALELSRSVSPSAPVSNSILASKPNISSPPAALFGSSGRIKSQTDSELSERMVSIKLEESASPRAISTSESAQAKRPSLQSILPPKCNEEGERILSLAALLIVCNTCACALFVLHLFQLSNFGYSWLM